MNLSAYSMDLRRTVTPAHHVYTVSGACSVQPLVNTVAGVGDLFSPPIVARGLRLLTSLQLDDRVMEDNGNWSRKGDVGILYSGGTWHLDGVDRKGTYHHYRDGRLDSLSLESRLTPLADAAGYILKLIVRNRGTAIKRLAWKPKLDPGALTLRPLSTWDFSQPLGDKPVTQVAADRWENDDLTVRLIHQERAVALASGESCTMWLALHIAPRGSSSVVPTPDGLEALEEGCRRRRHQELGRMVDRFPALQSDIPGLEEYYNRCLVSGLVSIWNVNDFSLNPWVATSGVDGGALCAYAWDNAGYAPGAMNLLLGSHVDEHIEMFARCGLDENNRVSLDGQGMACYYAYSLWSYIAFLHAKARMQGPPSDAQLEEAARLLESAERSRPARGDLCDFGDQSNLLEMRGTGWEHFVASPNAERAWCFETLANLSEGRGNAEMILQWRRKAAAIRRAIRRDLWDNERGWFRCRFPDGHEETVYSIQAFDALRLGACTPSMKTRLLEHVREGRFLGEYGVSSISAEDALHYDFNDPDWSGGGSFSGDGPTLALTLFEVGKPRLGWDVLRRYFWTGRHLLYHPQEAYCDKPGVVPYKRANNISGLTGAEAVLFGVAGLDPSLAGFLSIKPALPVKGEISISGFHCQGRQVDVQFTSRRLKVMLDGAETPDRRIDLSARD